MLPAGVTILNNNLEIEPQPSKTFCLDSTNKRISGMTDHLEAVRQAVYCILNTERFDWLIYSWNYGVEIKALTGRPVNLVQSKIKKRIREALMQDDRIRSVDAFSFTISGKKLSVVFEVHTNQGDIVAEKEVDL